MAGLPESVERDLVDPVTRQPLRRVDEGGLAALRRALSAGLAARVDGQGVPERVEGAYADPEGRRVFLVVEGVPHLLPEECVELEEPLGGT